MRIVLVSPFNIGNYGAMLQGWALRTTLERMGHDVKHLNATWLWHGIRGWWQVLKSRSLTNMIGKIRINKMMRSAYATMGAPPMTVPYKSLKSLKAHPPEADCYIAGSDQIWDEEWFKLGWNVDVILLNFGGGSVMRLAYAPSTSRPHWSERGVCCARKYAPLFKRFKAISAREESGCHLIQSIFGCCCSWVPDPTLLLGYDDYLSMIGEDRDAIGSGDHIFVYLLGFDERRRIEMVHKICNERMKIDPSVNEVHRVKVPAKLDDWLFEIASSRFVVTNSFHGLCFALLFHRPFVMVGFDGDESWRNERVKSLLGRLNMADVLIASYDALQVAQLVQKKFNWEEVDGRVEEFRQDGVSFLLRNLAVCG